MNTNVKFVLKLLEEHSFQQRQDSSRDQLEDLIFIAEKMGMYDAADYLKLMTGTGTAHTHDPTPERRVA